MRATPAPTSAHQRKPGVWIPCAAILRQPAPDRLSLGMTLRGHNFGSFASTPLHEAMRVTTAWVHVNQPPAAVDNRDPSRPESGHRSRVRRGGWLLEQVERLAA